MCWHTCVLSRYCCWYSEHGHELHCKSPPLNVVQYHADHHACDVPNILYHFSSFIAGVWLHVHHCLTATTFHTRSILLPPFFLLSHMLLLPTLYLPANPNIGTYTALSYHVPVSSLHCVWWNIEDEMNEMVQQTTKKINFQLIANKGYSLEHILRSHMVKISIALLTSWYQACPM